MVLDILKKVGFTATRVFLKGDRDGAVVRRAPSVK
jgi:hypothetical protein